MRRFAPSMVALLGLLTMIPTSELAAQPGGAKSTAQKPHAADDKEAAPGAQNRQGREDREDREDREEAQAPVLPTDEELDFERPRDLNLLSSEEMLSLSVKYEADIENDVANVEAARANAYKERDVIKLTCIDDKLVQMRLISNSMAPRFQRISRLRREEFAVRAEFSIIAPAWKRSKELRRDVESCIGETLNNVSVVSVTTENPDPKGGPDPTAAPRPGVAAERPPEASSYR